MCFDPRRHLLHGNFGHHLVEDRPHDLDQFWTVARHDPLSRFVTTGIWITLLRSLPRKRCPDWVTDLITAFAERARMSDAAVLEGSRVAGWALTGQTQNREPHLADVRLDVSRLTKHPLRRQRRDLRAETSGASTRRYFIPPARW